MDIKICKSSFIAISRKSDKQNLPLTLHYRIYIPQDNIRDQYNFIKVLGEGAYGTVYLASLKTTGEKRAVKAIPKDKVEDKESFANEISILKQLDHPNIIKLFEIYETNQTVYLVTEVCEGGELFYHIKKTKFLSEQQCALIMRQIFSAIAYCHENHIAHRDLKPENFLLKYENDDSTIKLIDFGLAKKLKPDELITQPNGTPFYVAPEVIDGCYTEEVDNWALGVILYIMLCGVPPFYGKSNKEILAAIKKGTYTMSYKPFENVSADAKDLIQKLIVKDPKRRLTASQAFMHPWVQAQVQLENSNLLVDPAIFANLESFIEATTLKKTLLIYLAQQVPDKDVEVLKQIFVKLDKNGNGILSKTEFVQGLNEFIEATGNSLTLEKIEKLFVAIDMDKSGNIDYSEFLSCFIESLVLKNEKMIQAAFEKLDSDGNGTIDAGELRQFLGGSEYNLDKKDLEALIKEADINGDGLLDYAEVLRVLKQRTRGRLGSQSL